MRRLALESDLMRVPKSFKLTVRRISQKQGKSMSDVLRDGEKLLTNAEFLTEFIFGRRKKK